ncbi:acyl transferase/acyl hydrolase/lysophospholipase [Exophiala viscosa]|uniref:Acyl transferase/acyl hydrolase/lysophospholipase n=2 Tax=Exophiala viscosa TaxID=2486360 RepID=A0AAN6E6D8_9EURO|nr:acyl transferase/acyl hydrolase/lysophospholipase [Exophiala viscosa]
MEKIAQIEQQNPEPAYHSFYPASYKDPKSGSAQSSINGSTEKESRLNQDDISSATSDLKRPEYMYLPCHYFDFMAGTSTGGLIAMMLGRLRMTVGHCIEEYISLGGKVFGKPRRLNARSNPFSNRGKYDCDNVEKVVEKVTGLYNPSIQTELWDKVPLKSPEKLCKTMVVATNEDGRKPYIFRSYDIGNPPKSKRHHNPGPAHEYFLSTIAKATSAAPGYFDPLLLHGITFLDGGLVANNPTVEAYNEVSWQQGNKAPALVLSIGTGEKEKRTLKTLEKHMKHWKHFISYEINYRIAESQSADDDMTDERDDGKVQYERLTVTLDFGLGWMKLDEWKRRPQATKPVDASRDTQGRYMRQSEYFRQKKSKHHDTVRFLEARTKLYLNQQSVQKQLERLAGFLVKRRRLRSKTPLWNHFATGDKWRCPKNDHCPGSPFDTWEGLLAHFAKSHSHSRIPDARDCVRRY